MTDDESVRPSAAKQTLHLDGRVPLDKIANVHKRQRIHQWMRDVAERLDIEERVFDGLNGVVFEVRQGYKSKDSKRQRADIANACAAYTRGYIPCNVILSTQIDSEISLRYSAAKWVVLTGVTSVSDPLVSTYDFMENIIGYDLAGFFNRNQRILQEELERVLTTVLNPNGG